MQNNNYLFLNRFYSWIIPVIFDKNEYINLSFFQIRCLNNQKAETSLKLFMCIMQSY